MSYILILLSLWERQFFGVIFEAVTICHYFMADFRVVEVHVTFYLCSMSYSFESHSWRGLLDAKLCDKICQWLKVVRWFSHVLKFPPSINYRHYKAKILLKVALKTIRRGWRYQREVIRIRISKKNRQLKGKKKYKGQTTIYKTYT